MSNVIKQLNKQHYQLHLLLTRLTLFLSVEKLSAAHHLGVQSTQSESIYNILCKYLTLTH